jgi:hypothetical protein
MEKQESAASLIDLEAVIEEGKLTHVQVGIALREIKERKLYRQSGYETFKEYRRKRYPMVKLIGPKPKKLTLNGSTD